ncbi:MAG TPA: Fic family protein [Acidothermaceae bacterium]
MRVASEHPAGVLEIATPARKSTLSRAVKAGGAIRLAPSIFVLGATLPAEQAVNHHRFAIAAQIWPGAVICDASALAGGEATAGWMFICHPDPPRSSDLHLPGLSIAPRVGPGRLPGDMALPFGLSLSGPARTLVENVPLGGPQPRSRPPRAAGVEAVEDRIDAEARTGGAGRIRAQLTQLDVIASSLPTKQVDLVRRRLAAVLGSFVGDAPPRSPRLRARLSGQPYDQHRIDMFAALAALLGDTAPQPRPALGGDERWRWLAFFEAYFSNFIEGTEFGVEEARLIAIDGFEPADRPQDAHDVAATFRIASDPRLSHAVAKSGDELLDMLRAQHEVLMAARPEKRPGQFKGKQNYAGGYVFVAPDLVRGTLLRGFDCFTGVTDPFQRAVALMLLLTECHPFDDGNGRIARLVSNATLSAAGQVRVVIPTVYRNNYLAGLSGVSNGAGRGETLVSVLAFAQKWTASVDWSGWDFADVQMRDSNAYVDPGLAEQSGQRLRLASSLTGA